jgi:hypothetical protein
VRAHYFAPVQGPAGDLQQGATVAVFANGSTANGTQLGTLTTAPLYADAASAAVMTNPFIATAGNVNFYMAYPQRVDLGVQVAGQAQVFFPDVDVNISCLVPVTVTANYSVQLSDQLVMASAASGNVTLTLPAATAGFQVTVKRTDSSGNTMGVAAPAGVLIEGSASPWPLAALGRNRFYSDGSAYWVI